MKIGTGTITFGSLEVGVMEDPHDGSELSAMIEEFGLVDSEPIEVTIKDDIEGWGICQQIRAQDIFNGVYEWYRRRG